MTDAAESTVLAFGGGRSYGDAALNSRGRTVIVSRLDRLLQFDAEQAVLVAEAGVKFRDVVETFLPQGYLPVVAPGTGFATLGGGVANDVHGKNHHSVGSFGHHLEWFDLRTPDGNCVHVDAQRQPSLFKATLGGLGLTGIIERLAIRLQKVPSNAVFVRKQRIADLDAFLAAFEAEASRCNYIVGWIDALAKRRSLGRGILETAVPATQSLATGVRRSARIPVDFPPFTLNPMFVKAFNSFYRRRVPARGWEGLMPYQQFLFPLDAVHDWNRIYGKRGFRQFQCIVPFTTGRDALRKILEEIASIGRASFLAVLKAMGPRGLGYLSFPMPGYTLALDFPNTYDSLEFIGKLERIAAEHGGRVYLAKDSTLSADLFREMYPATGEFLECLKRVDPLRRMRSDMAVRLNLRHD